MYQENCKKEKIKFLKLVIIIFMYYLLIVITKYVLSENNINSVWADIGIILVIAIGIYTFLIKDMIYYKYSIIEKELVIIKVIGMSEKVKMSIHKDQIIEIVEKSKGKDIDRNKEKYNFKGKLHSKTTGKIYYCIYKDIGSKCIVEIQPTPQLLLHIQ